MLSLTVVVTGVGQLTTDAMGWLGWLGTHEMIITFGLMGNHRFEEAALGGGVARPKADESVERPSINEHHFILIVCDRQPSCTRPMDQSTKSTSLSMSDASVWQAEVAFPHSGSCHVTLRQLHCFNSLPNSHVLYSSIMSEARMHPRYARCK